MGGRCWWYQNWLVLFLPQRVYFLFGVLYLRAFLSLSSPASYDFPLIYFFLQLTLQPSIITAIFIHASSFTLISIFPPRSFFFLSLFHLFSTHLFLPSTHSTASMFLPLYCFRFFHFALSFPFHSHLFSTHLFLLQLILQPLMSTSISILFSSFTLISIFSPRNFFFFSLFYLYFSSISSSTYSTAFYNDFNLYFFLYFPCFFFFSLFLLLSLFSPYFSFDLYHGLL